MKLRSRLALTLALLVVPFAVAIAWWQVEAQREAFEEQTAEAVRARMLAGEREACEASPETWPRMPLPPRMPDHLHELPPHARDRIERRMRRREERERRGRRGRGRGGPRGVELRTFAYDADFLSARRDAPPFDPALRAELEAGADEASRDRSGADDTRLVAVRMPWDEGPCVHVLVVRSAPGHPSFARVLAPSLVVSLAAVLLAVIAVGPIVRRVRALTAAVRAPAREGDAALDARGGDEIAELARAFAEARGRIRAQLEELEAREAALRRYVADTTHDVALPLTVLQGHLAALDRALEEGRPVERARVEDALEECHYLGSLLRNLSVAAKLQAGERGAEMHPVDLRQIVERVIGRNAPYAETRGLELNHSVPESAVSALADPTLVEQAISNVIHNAIRYGRRGGHVAAILEARAGGGFRLEVIDDGPGMPEAELARITERGFRGDAARTRHPTGTGLGLAIVRDVAERHGWELAIANRDEGGLRVTLEAPAP